MLLERAELSIEEGLETEFAAAFKDRAKPILASVPGVKSIQYGFGVENPQKFLILVEWESLDAHAAFKKLPVYPSFGAVFAPYSTGGSMEHFTVS